MTLVEGPSAGSDSVVLAVTAPSGAWTATANATWLHLNPATQSGAGSANIIFDCDANTSATRTGTLTIGGQTLTVTQAASNYVAASEVATLVSSGLDNPFGVAVDHAGNVYIADSGSNTITEWSPVSNTLTTLVSSGLSSPGGVAVDGAGNVYIADTGNGAIKEWLVANSNVIILVSSGLSSPQGVAVDAMGNVFIADTSDGDIKERGVATGNVTTLLSGLNAPYSVAVDAAGNVYATCSGIIKWIAANNTFSNLQEGVDGLSCAVDGSGNVYTSEWSDDYVIQRWNATNGSFTTFLPWDLLAPRNIAADSAGNVYIADVMNHVIKEIPRAFVDPTSKVEGLMGGSDALSVVAPASANLSGSFRPLSDQTWLTITGITNGVVNFSFTATTSNRTGHISLLGQSIPVTQDGPSYSLGTTALLVGPGAGSNSVVLAAALTGSAWTAAPNAAWLHLSQSAQSGMGSTNVVFSYDANPNATRSGTLSIAGQTLTVTQAGSTYVQAGTRFTLGSYGLLDPRGVAVDEAGNVFTADTGNNEVKEWNVATGQTTILASGLIVTGVAADTAGNVYIVDIDIDNSIKEWIAASNSIITLVSPKLGAPFAVAVNEVGNVYIVDSGDRAIEMWTAVNSNFTAWVWSGFIQPQSIAVDAAGNVYIADSNGNAIKEWIVANGAMITLVTGLSDPWGVAVDPAGNVYIADTGNHAIKEWVAASNTLITLASSVLPFIGCVAVDKGGNVYIATEDVEELPYAFVDPTARLEGAAASSDVLPVVLPSTENLLGPFAPSSDQSWLAITGITNDVVSFSFTFNPLTNRTAHITLLGQSIAVTQAGAGVTPPTLTGLQVLGGGAVQFSFTNVLNASFTVLSTTNLALPLSNWTVVGAASNLGAGQFQVNLQPPANAPQSFYTIRSP